MKGPVLVLTLGFLAVADFAVAETPVKEVAGSVQLWSRVCPQADDCALPVAVGARHPVRGTVTAPAGPGHAGSFSTSLVDHWGDGELRLVLQVFWVAPPDGSTPYLVSQAKLVRDAEVPVSECTQYHGQDVARFFPVGACGGFVPSGDGQGYVELGVTFYKE